MPRADNKRSLRLPIAKKPWPLLPVLAAEEAAELPFQGLDTLWIQLTGTLCNIACRHCFITCGPTENRVPMMSRARIEELLVEARDLGIKEVYYTGGEPMLHPEFFEILERTLEVGPTSVLTNGLLIDDVAAGRLRRIFDAARYSLELRVSLDGMSASENDPVRGRGTFAAVTRAVARLAAVGLSPVITVVEHATPLGPEERQAFLAFARSLGLEKPRVKFLPLLRIGREPRRTRGYDDESVVLPPLEVEVAEALQCNNSRLATQDHVLTCPLLLDAPEARLGTRLADALKPIRLRWSACHTCVAEGLSCRT